MDLEIFQGPIKGFGFELPKLFSHMLQNSIERLLMIMWAFFWVIFLRCHNNHTQNMITLMMITLDIFCSLFNCIYFYFILLFPYFYIPSKGTEKKSKVK